VGDAWVAIGRGYPSSLGEAAQPYCSRSVDQDQRPQRLHQVGEVSVDAEFTEAELHRYADDAVRVFLAAYGAP
jgi:hypothetical protein